MDQAAVQLRMLHYLPPYIVSCHPEIGLDRLLLSLVVHGLKGLTQVGLHPPILQGEAINVAKEATAQLLQGRTCVIDQ